MQQRVVTDEPVGPGVFGKLPAHGDFVSRGLPHDDRRIESADVATALNDLVAAHGPKAMTSDAMSEKLCSASAISARLPDRMPPTICATVSRALAQIAIETLRSPDSGSMWAWP